MFLPQDISPRPEVVAGPIGTRNGRALSLPFMRFVPRIDFLGRHESQLEVGLQIANDVRRWPRPLSEPAIIEEDHETQRLSFLFSRGLGNGYEASIELPFLFRN